MDQGKPQPLWKMVQEISGYDPMEGYVRAEGKILVYAALVVLQPDHKNMSGISPCDQQAAGNEGH